MQSAHLFKRNLKHPDQFRCMPEETLAVVIPAKNEEDTVGEVIDLVRDEVSPYFNEVNFVVSSGSSDSTNEIAAVKGAKVIRDGGRGLGEAMFRGLKKAVDMDTDYILTIDSDLQFQPDEAPRLIENREKADLVLGSRFLEDGVEYEMSISHRIGNFILTGLVNKLIGQELTDAQTGYRLMTQEVAKELRMVGTHTYVQETIIDAHQNGFTLFEVPVKFAERESGGSKVVSSISQYGLRTLPVILHRTKMTAYLLNGASLLSLVAASLLILSALILQNIAFGAIGLLIILVSLQTLFLGMLIDGDLP